MINKHDPGLIERLENDPLFFQRERPNLLNPNATKVVVNPDHHKPRGRPPLRKPAKDELETKSIIVERDPNHIQWKYSASTPVVLNLKPSMELLEIITRLKLFINLIDKRACGSLNFNPFNDNRSK